MQSLFEMNDGSITRIGIAMAVVLAAFAVLALVRWAAQESDEAQISESEIKEPFDDPSTLGIGAMASNETVLGRNILRFTPQTPHMARDVRLALGQAGPDSMGQFYEGDTDGRQT